MGFLNIVMWGVCTTQYRKVYSVNHMTGLLVQDIFTNTIEHSEVFATRFIEKKTIPVPHMGVQNITITVHSFSLLMGVHYITNTVQSDLPLTSAFSHFVQVTITLLRSLHTCFLQMLHPDFTFRSFDLRQNSYLFALVC